jgi:hypothetical protein
MDAFSYFLVAAILAGVCIGIAWVKTDGNLEQVAALSIVFCVASLGWPIVLPIVLSTVLTVFIYKKLRKQKAA